MSGQLNGWTVGRMDDWMEEWMDKQQANRWTDGLMNVQKDGEVVRAFYKSLH